MRYQLTTNVLLLAIVSAVMPTQAIANTSTHSSSSDRPSAVGRSPYSEPARNQPEQAKTPNQPTQLSQPSPSTTQAKPDKDIHQFYPAYCKFYLSNVEPGSWQFQQDLQRCVYGQ